MKTSIWLTNFEKEVNEKRSQSNQKKKVIFIILPIMMALFSLPTLTSNDTLEPQVKMGILIMLGIFVFIFLFVILLLNISKKIDATAVTRKNLMALLQSDEEVDAFDQQMSSPNLKEIKMNNQTNVIITNDYIALSFYHSGDLQYRFARIKDISIIACSKTGSINASHCFDIKNNQNNIILQGTFTNKSLLDEMIDSLNELQPDIKIEN